MFPEPWQQFFSDSIPPVGTLCTSDGAGQVNAAVFGSARLFDDGATLALALGDNRTLRNLRRHPAAVFLLARPGTTLTEWQGIRLYLQLQRLESDGELFAAMQAETERLAGRRAARRQRAVALFCVETVRPLLDLHP